MIQERTKGVCSLAGCGKAGAARCSRCKVWYCSLQCQEDDWPTHLRFCFEIPPLEWLDPENNRNPSITSTNSGNTVHVGSVEATEVQVSGTGDVKNMEKMDAGIAINSNLVSREENNNSTVMATEKEILNTEVINKETRGSKVEVEKEKEQELSTQKAKEETKPNNLDVMEAVEKTKPVAQNVEGNGQETKPAAKDGEESEAMIQGTKSSEVKQQESFKYKEAFISPKVQAQLPEEMPDGWSDMVVSYLVSPSEFYIRLLADVSREVDLCGSVSNLVLFRASSTLRCRSWSTRFTLQPTATGRLAGRSLSAPCSRILGTAALLPRRRGRSSRCSSSTSERWSPSSRRILSVSQTSSRKFLRLLTR